MRILIALLATIISIGSADAFWFGGGSGAGTPAGTNTDVQINDSGAFGSDAHLRYSIATHKLTLGDISGSGFTGDLQNNGNSYWNKVMTVTVTALTQALPDGYSVRVALTGTDAQNVYGTGNANAVRVMCNAATIATTLNGAITSTAATITLASTAGYADTGIIKIENERISYVGIDATHIYNCVRGASGTDPAAHTDGLAVVTVQEVERFISAFEVGNIVIWFKLRANILAEGSDNTYRLYYGNALAGTPPTMIDSVFAKKYEGDTGLRGEWNMDEGVNSSLTDSSGNANNCTLFNTPTWVATDGGQWNGSSTANFEIGSHLQFTAAQSEYAQSDANIGISGAQAFTIEFWIEDDAIAPNVNYMSIGNAAANNLVGICSDNPISSTSLFLNYWNGYNTAINIAPETLANKCFVVYRYSGTTETLYVNNVLKHTRAISLNITDAPIRIGGRTGGYAGQYSNAHIDGAKTYNRQITVDEINAHYKRRACVTDDTTIVDGDFTSNSTETSLGVGQGLLAINSSNASGAAVAISQAGSGYALQITGKVKNALVPVYADNAAAIAGGLVVNDEYQTATGVQMRVY